MSEEQTSTTAAEAPPEQRRETYDNREDWLEARRKSIGSSDIAAIVGESSRVSPYSLWSEKTGRAAEEEEEDNELLEWGHRNEGAIADKARDILWAEDPTINIYDPGDFAITRSLEHPFASASLDREVYRASDLFATLELKNTGSWMSQFWVEEVPLGVQIQAQWQMLVTGLGTSFVAALVGGNSFRWAKVLKDEVLQKILLAAATEFWGRVDRDEAPLPDAHAATKRALYRRYSGSDGSEVKLGAGAEEAWRMLERAKERRKANQSEVDEMTAILIGEIGDAEQGVLPDGTILGLNRISIGAKTIERKASSYLRLTRRGAYGHLQQKGAAR